MYETKVGKGKNWARTGGLISVYDNTDGNIYNHYNHRGDVINVTDEQESIISTNLYDAFGSLKLEKGQYDSQFKFSTKEYDTST